MNLTRLLLLMRTDVHATASSFIGRTSLVIGTASPISSQSGICSLQSLSPRTCGDGCHARTREGMLLRPMARRNTSRCHSQKKLDNALVIATLDTDMWCNYEYFYLGITIYMYAWACSNMIRKRERKAAAGNAKERKRQRQRRMKSE